ncbi:inovirus-type Gp2 protein [bacterium SCSIO 12696]|nr:inovirus-type Gp2 protein [bacterium SCSIO 12696]
MKTKREPRVLKSSKFDDFKVQASKQLGLYSNILKKTITQLKNCLSRSSRVFTFRFDLHLPDDFDGRSDSEVISRFFTRLSKYLKAGRVENHPHRNHKYVSFQWVKEVERSKKCHYHCWIAVDGKKVRVPGSVESTPDESTGLIGLIMRLWAEESGGGSVYLCDKPRMLKRGDSAAFEDCVRHYSYLSKVRGKGYGGIRPGEKNHGGSRIKPKAGCASNLMGACLSVPNRQKFIPSTPIQGVGF